MVIVKELWSGCGKIFQTLNYTSKCIKDEISSREGLPCEDFYLTFHGKILDDESQLPLNSFVYAIPRLNGGKGGFGSMLRAIGAQIEKTTNREACRDLSGRRLRDINEEKRLKKWISEQTERESDVVKRKLERLERLKAEPKHEFNDPEYDKQRSQLSDNVNDALMQGLKSVSQSKSNSNLKRKSTDKPEKDVKKKRMWMGMDELSGESDLGSDASGTESDSSIEESKSLPSKSEKFKNKGKSIEIASESCSSSDEKCTKSNPSGSSEY